MGKGTRSMGKRSKGKTHMRCRRCGRNAYHLRDKRCASCGFGATARRRGYAWAKLKR